MKKVFTYLCLAFLMVGCTKSTLNKTDYQVPAPEDVVMYQVNPRNYASREAFQAITLHLDSIKQLGANVVWFMPIYEIGVENSVHSPYCIKNYVDTDKEFGTVEQFKALVEACHQRGMAVLLDWVANHTSWDNPWIKDHPEWYTQDEEGNIIWPEGTGWRDVADLNFDNAQMRQAMIDAMKFWVTEVGVDGFRCDAADYVPLDFWKECLIQLRAIEGHPLLMLAEGQRKGLFDVGFDMNYAWGWMSALRRVYNGAPVAMGERRRMGPVSVSTLFETDSMEYAGLPEGKMKLRFTTNHDETSEMSPIREFFGEEGSMAAFVASAFIHGGMLIYGSQEVGYPGKINFFNYVNVDWNAHSDLFSEYCQLVRIFKSTPSIRKGALKPYKDNDVLMFERSLDKERVLVMINMRDAQHTVAIPAEWKNAECVDLMTNHAVTLSENERMFSPFEYIILKRK